MADDMRYALELGGGANALNWRRQIAWILVCIADTGFVAWGAMAAALPDQLRGPGGARRS